jgi:hypothetical protein
MNNQTQEPMPPDPGDSTSFFQVWINALTKPNEQTFAQMVESPNATLKTAFLWIFIAGAFSWFVSSIFGLIFSAIGLTAQTPAQQFGGAASGFGVLLAIAVCGAPIFGALSVVGLIINTGITQFVAGLFGGTGSFTKLAYGFAAILTPVTLVTGLISIFSAIPLLGICIGLLNILISIYVLVIEVIATKAVNNFGWSKAAVSVLLIPMLVAMLCILPISIMRLLGPKIGDTYSSINNSLP